MMCASPRPRTRIGRRPARSRRWGGGRRSRRAVPALSWIASLLGHVPKTALGVVDEAYHHFVEDVRYASAFDWVGRVANLLVVRTFSKIYGLAGMRLCFFSSRRRHTRFDCDWSSDVCSSD